MSFDYDKLKNWPFEEITQTYTSRDTILYALGVGLGADPMDEQQLQYVFEEAEPFMALPTMAVVLGSPGFWSRDPETCLLYTSPSPRDATLSRMPSSA